ncbi:anaerobic ribonucleoside-triphosphate reductase activating protein [Ruminococcus albus]|uniref:Anaerobic ribonucleoside-triphosphate reductase-activating protein n=1 Tax=Ruminococcus albus TaxID=1264 RepID=A0A1H7F9H1_RUMAL|nr:anaerobic ribonucleoside-triphosphate reductase activating protein [Ruminococcus albus]SEK21032.1 anaerobic ribonucleoside-triphosphate reductase activating protein [Ruminococcus albus]
MNYGEIKNCDIADGIGVRVSLFVSGCTHCCEGCFNKMTWDFGYGKLFNAETENELLEMLSPDYIDGLTLLGGEPMEPDNQRALVPFLRRVREKFPTKSIWCYTGCVLEKHLLAESHWRCECTDEMLSMIDVLVDGEFILARRNISLAFRGSDNQRIVDLKKTLSGSETVLIDFD